MALYPRAMWRVTVPGKKKLYLTFDDGPTPGVTEQVLTLLDKYEAKATFFCLGKNVKASPGIYNELKQAGHTLANHGYHHLNGWRTPAQDYVDNALRAAELIDCSLYRPPYGRITAAQSRQLQQHFTIVMWSLLSGDFDPSVKLDKRIQTLCTASQPGHILVFHDSVKAAENLHYMLPKLLETLTEKGFTFDVLPQNVK